MKVHILLIFIFVANSFFIDAQITVNKSSGCAPLTGVTFSSPTVGDWDFGNGVSAIGTNSASAIYGEPGIYTVTLNDGTTTYNTTITVYGNPKPDFSTNGSPNGCLPFTPSLIDASSGQGSSAIVDWKWTFGNGAGSSVQNPNYTYTNLGTYTISLIVTDDKGCDSAVVKTDFITVSTPPSVNFTASPLSSCTAPLNVIIANNSTDGSGGTVGLEYDWDFGNTQTSTSKDPVSQTYTTNGNYPITLTVLKDGGCPRSQTKNINIGKPEAIINSPDTICISTSTRFFDASNGGTSYKWTFDDGGVVTTSTSKNPFSTFNSAGNQTITLIVNDAGCSDTTSKTIFVQDPQITLVADPSYKCDKPFCVQFTAVGANIDTWAYEFGDGQGQTSSEQNPEYCYTYLGGNEYTVYDYNGYKHTTIVTGTTKNGCSATANFTDTIIPISANFAPNITQGCFPLEVTFQDSSASGSPIISYEYDFDDGSKSSSDSSTHIFNSAGEYNVTLIIENQRGCRDTSFPVEIQVGAQIDVDLSVTPSSVCIGDTVIITDSTGDPRIDGYHFSTDENRGSESCPGDSIQQWSYFHETGSHDITFFANYNGCISEKPFANAVTVKGPSSYFKWSGNCETPTEINFEATVSDVDSLYWYFGDGDTLASDDLADSSLTHSYLASGDYTVILKSTNSTSGCDNDIDTMLIKVRLLEAVIEADSLICAGSFIASGEKSVDVDGNCNNAYRWDYGDGTEMYLSNDASWPTALSDTGSYKIRLMVYDINGCRDTTEKEIEITKLYAGFTADTTTGCIPLTINFTDTSWSATKLETWSWDFKDGNTGAGATTSNTYTKSSIASYNVILNVTDSLGCTDEASLVISPIIPDSIFQVDDPTICVGDKALFTLRNQNSMESANWNFGDQGSSTELNPTFQFDTSGNYTINVVLTDTNGCQTQKTITTYMFVDAYPTAGFSSSVDGQSNICHPAPITFTDTSIVNFGVTSFGNRFWDLGTGNPILNTLVSPTDNYNEPGDYTIKLIEESTNGCRDTVTKTITIVGPKVDFSALPSIICVGDKISFNIIDSSDVFAYQWGFGDANITDTMYISNVTSADTSHRYTSVPLGGTTKAQLVVWSEGFACSYYKKKDINMYNIEANFGFADSTVCLDADVVFGDTSLSTGATTYSWDLGNGSSFDYVSKNVPTPERYNTTGDFDVRLIINDPVSGCIDTAIKKLVILPLPQVATIDREVCRGNPAQLVASGASVYIWNDPSLTIENIDTSWTLAYPDTSTSYEVLGTDTVSNCSNKAVANIGVLQEKELVRKDTCIIIGDSVTIGTDYGSDYKYDWTEGPTQFLNCLDCPVQTIQISEEVDSILYELSYTDSLNCFPKVNEYNICVEDKYTVDVPSAFTPDGSGNNDVIYVNGHGIKELIYFRIYNRWGELIFETTNLEKGWDGIYKGNAQGIETFVYQAKVKFYNDQFETKGGDITLIR